MQHMPQRKIDQMLSMKRLDNIIIERSKNSVIREDKIKLNKEKKMPDKGMKKMYKTKKEYSIRQDLIIKEDKKYDNSYRIK